MFHTNTQIWGITIIKKILGFYSDYLLKYIMFSFIPCGLCFGHFGGTSCFHLQGCSLWNEKCCLSNETSTWCNTAQVLFLQSHSACFGRKRPSSGVFKTSTAATGTCVIVAGKSSHLLIRIRSRTVQPVVSRYTDWHTRPWLQDHKTSKMMVESSAKSQYLCLIM